MVGRKLATGLLRLKIATGTLLAIITALVALYGNASASDAAALDAQFRQFLDSEIWPEARARGVREDAFRRALSGVSLKLDLPDLVIPGQKKDAPRKQSQAEFRTPAAYFSEKVLGGVVSGGQERKRRHAAILAGIEARTGVPGRFLLAVWGRESAFGRADIPHDAFEVLATKAFLATRKEMFRRELLAALEMVSRHRIDPSLMKGSWAGALGQPQFMPTSYLAHARDFDGDGMADIWNSVPDVLGSMASYLEHSGWVKGRDWGFEVSVPASVSCALEGQDRGRKISEWEKLGIRRINGNPFPRTELRQDGFLLMPAGRFGPAFVVTPNFYVFKEYNFSDNYALFIGHAGDRIEWGGGPFAGRWGDVGSMYRSDVAEIQRRLEKLGFDVGGADGLPGFKTRRSIGEWQQANGMEPDCYPTPELARRLGG